MLVWFIVLVCVIKVVLILIVVVREGINLFICKFGVILIIFEVFILVVIEIIWWLGVNIVV